MVYLYRDLTKLGYSDYQIKKQVLKKKLYMIEKGIYSTSEDVSPLEIIVKKHPNAIVTLETACVCYKLLKKDEKCYQIATKQKDRKILDPRVKQIFMTDSLYEIGKSTITYQNFKINIYDLERLLIEIVRNKTSIPFEIYHEIITNYKKLNRLLSQKKLNEYIKKFKNDKIKFRIENEVFKK